MQAENPRLPLLSNSPFPGLQEFQKQSVPLTERAKNPGLLFQRARGRLQAAVWEAHSSWELEFQGILTPGICGRHTQVRVPIHATADGWRNGSVVRMTGCSSGGPGTLTVT